MKTITTIFSLLVSISLFCQIPNASFEYWEQDSVSEYPSDWQTNNAGQDFISVSKVESLTDGDFAMRVVNRGPSFEGFAPGYAFCTFLPNGTFNQLNLAYRIDSISGGANIEIRVFQFDGNQYNAIGSWMTENTTDGIEELDVSISQINNDTMLIEIRSNSVETATGLVGYAEIIVDNLNLKLSSSTKQHVEGDHLLIYPNPTDGEVNVSDFFIGSKYEIHDIGGRLVDSGEISGTSLQIKKQGLFVLSVKTGNNWIHRKILVEK